MPSNVIIITAYNAPHLLEMQLPAIRKYVADVDVIVLDNSSSKHSKGLNDAIAKANYCQYHLMKFDTKDPSRHHASALNWSVSQVWPSYDKVLLLDHDVVPFKDVGVFLNLHSLHGVYQCRMHTSYIHPGFMLIDTKICDGLPFDFMPCDNFDTGGRMAVFNKHMTFCPVAGHEGFEIYDSDWLHMSKGCNWNGASDYDVRLQKYRDVLKALSL